MQRWRHTSSAYLVAASGPSLYSTVESSPWSDGTGEVPTFFSRKAPVPYLRGGRQKAGVAREHCSWCSECKLVCARVAIVVLVCVANV